MVDLNAGVVYNGFTKERRIHPRCFRLSGSRLTAPFFSTTH